MLVRLLILLLLLVTKSASAELPGIPIELTTTNSISLRGPIDGPMISEAIISLELNTSKEIYLFIDSPGGSVYAGNVLMDYLQNTKKPIVCIASNAASMAFAILQMCPRRLVLPTSILMQHRVLIGLPQQSLENNEEIIEMIKKSAEHLYLRQAKRLQMTLAEFKDRIKFDWWLYGHDAVASKAADAVVEVTCSTELYLHIYEIPIRTPAGIMSLRLSACPLLSSPLP